MKYVMAAVIGFTCVSGGLPAIHTVVVLLLVALIGATS